MPRIKIRDFLPLVFLLSFSDPAFSFPDPAFDLEPIVINKNRSGFFKSYSSGQGESGSFSPGSLVERLQALPVDLQSRSPEGDIQTDFSLRGSNFQGVLVAFDGQRINDPQTGHYSGDIPLTDEDIAGVDVIPGAASALFGADAIGGAINIIPKKPVKKQRVLELAGGSFNSGRGILSFTERINNLGVRFSCQREESSGFRYDTDYRKLTATMASSLEMPSGELNTNFGYEQKAFGAFDFYTPGSGYPSREWIRTYLLNTGMILQENGLLIRSNFLWRRHYDKFVLDKTLIRSLYTNHHRTDVFMPQLYLQREAGKLGRLGWGVEYREEKIDSDNLGRHSRGQYSVFTDDVIDINSRLSLGSSLRWDEFSTFGQVYSGSLNFKYLLSPGEDLTLGVSRNIRIPTFTELYYSDPTTLGNANLSEERSTNYQAGYNHKQKGFSWGATIFYREENEFIDWVKHSPGQAKWQVENITSAQVNGIEVYFRKALNRCADFNANYTYINKRIDERGLLYKYGQNFANHQVSTGLSFDLPFGVQTITLNYKKKPARRGWFLLDASFSYNLNRHSLVFLKAANLLNVAYQEIEGIPQPGRYIEGGLRFTW